MDNKKLKELEQRIERLETAQGVNHSVVKKNSESDLKNEPNAFSNFFNGLFKDWLIKIGALLLVLALAWFVRYSFLEGWVGPVGRITFGYLFTVSLFFLGNQQLQKRRTPATFLLAIGFTGILLTTFAAREMYDFFTPAIALAIMVLATIATIFVSHANKLIKLAVLGLLGGAVAPLLAVSSVPNYNFFAFYAFILTISYLIVTTLNDWDRLRAITCLVWIFMIETVIYSISIYLFVSLLLLFFATMIFAYMYSSKNNKKPIVLDLIVINLLGLFTMLSIADLVKVHLIGLVLVSIAVGVMLLADRLYKLLKPSIETFYGITASAITIFFAATIYQFDGVVLNLALSFEILALIFVTKKLLKKDSWAEYLAFLFVIPGIWAFGSFNSLYYSSTIFNTYLLDIFGFVLILAATLAVLKPTLKSKPVTDVIVPALYVAFIGYLYGLIWVVNAVIFKYASTGKSVSLVIFTILGLGAYFSAIRLKTNYLKYTGIFTLAFVVIRLLLVEVWDMTLVARVITFLLIGLMMVGTSFYEKKYITKK